MGLQSDIIDTIRSICKGRMNNADEALLITMIAGKRVDQIHKFAVKLGKSNGPTSQLHAGDWHNLRNLLNQLSGKAK